MHSHILTVVFMITHVKSNKKETMKLTRFSWQHPVIALASSGSVLLELGPHFFQTPHQIALGLNFPLFRLPTLSKLPNLLLGEDELILKLINQGRLCLGQLTESCELASWSSHIHLLLLRIVVGWYSLLFFVVVVLLHD